MQKYKFMPPRKSTKKKKDIFTNKNEISTQNMAKSANEPPNPSVYDCGKSSHMGRPLLS